MYVLIIIVDALRAAGFATFYANGKVGEKEVIGGKFAAVAIARTGR